MCGQVISREGEVGARVNEGGQGMEKANRAASGNDMAGAELEVVTRGDDALNRSCAKVNRECVQGNLEGTY
jgi:hypothetical protein